MDKNLHTWQQGIAMAENHAKREGQLLGRLNNQKHRAPRGIIAGEKLAKNGDFIRVLGVPMGNKIDEHRWWMTRYRTVKSQVAAWTCLGHLSISGRNMVVQSIYFGSFCFWLYSMGMPQQMLTVLQEDAKEILWSAGPSLFSNEVGTAAPENLAVT